MSHVEPKVHSGLIRARSVMTLAQGVEGDALWWQDGAVRAVGRVEDLERTVPTRVPRYDLPSTLVTPGFVDGHTHFGMWAIGRRRVHLAGAATRAEALERIARGRQELGWVLGHGWDANRWEAPPDRWSLDAVTTGPAFLESIDIHAGWANSAALAQAGIGHDTPDPPGGRIVRDGNGLPTGLLLERAVELVQPLLPSPSPADLRQAMQEGQALAHRAGLTGLHDVEGPEVLRAFHAMEARQALKLRVLFSPPVAQLPMLLASGARSGQGSRWLALGGVKLFLDGSLGSRTAWMLEPYEDGQDRGMALGTPEEAQRAVRAAAEGGLACVVHAIGDAAVRLALDLLESVPAAALPHRIEHFQCVHADDLERAARRGIVVSMQPAHLPADVHLADERWGHRSRGAYAFQSLRRAGAVLAFGSDVPVAPLDPRPGVVAAMARTAADGGFAGGWHPEERLTFAEAVQAYTIGNAVASGSAPARGRLAPGCDADLVAWDVDRAVTEGEASAFREARVRLTVVGGEVVYSD